MRTRKRKRYPNDDSMFGAVFKLFNQFDIDGDGVPNARDCRPFNPFMHGTGYIYDEQGKILKKGDLQKMAKEFFGVTQEHREAGYILPSGEMLDFTGRHMATGYKNRKPVKDDYLRNTRAMDHRDIGSVMDKGGNEAMLQFQDEEKAIRFSKFKDGDIHVDLVHKPTPEQIKAMVMAVMMQPRGDYLLMERTTPKGMVEDPIKHRLETTRPHPIMIQKFIARAFKNNR